MVLGSIIDGVIRYGTGSLWPTITLQFLWDSSGALGMEGIGATIGPLLQGPIAVTGVISLIVIARRHRGSSAVGQAAATPPGPLESGAHRTAP